MIRVNNIELSEGVSDRDIIVGARLTHGISTHYGHLPNSGDINKTYEISNINQDVKLNNILSSTSRDLKVSPFVLHNNSNNNLKKDHFVSNNEVINIIKNKQSRNNRMSPVTTTNKELLRIGCTSTT
jgi:hypothetical protein